MERKKRRIDRKSSRTAGFNCMYRAASYLSKNSYCKSNDYIAPRILPRFLLMLIENNLINFHWSFFPKGIYEYVISRTKYIDELCERLIDSGIDQIAVIGAGFDSRSVRFAEEHKPIRIYELDTLYTQAEKIEQFRRRNIAVTDNVIFVPINFNNESLQEKLVKSGFNRSKGSLFILEGIIIYLHKEAVSKLFTALYELSNPGSKVVFDYIYASVLRRENKYYGEKNIYRKVNRVNESWTFGLEDGEVEEYLKQFGFTLMENMNAEDLEKKYFTDTEGNRLARINGTHCVAYAGR